MWVVGVLYVKPTQKWRDKESIGLYRDDDLGVFHNIPLPEIERKQKQIVERFKESGYLSSFSKTWNR